MIIKAMQGLNLKPASGVVSDGQRMLIIFTPYIMSRIFVNDKDFQQDLLLSSLGNVFMMYMRRTLLKKASPVAP